MSESRRITHVDFDPDATARCVLDAFDRLPASRKPRDAASGLGEKRREWVPLAGIVLQGPPPFYLIDLEVYDSNNFKQMSKILVVYDASLWPPA